MFIENTKKLRLFIGSRIEFSIIEEEFKTKLTEYFICPVRFVPNQNLHLTWKFIGETEAEKLGKVENILEEIIKENLEILINFSKFEIWPNANRPSLLVLRGNDLNGNAEKLYQKLDKQFEKLNLTRDKRKFSPHITIARFKVKQKPAEKFVIPKWLVFNGIDIKFSELSVFKSELTKNGSIYTPIKSYYI